MSKRRNIPSQIYFTWTKGYDDSNEKYKYLRIFDSLTNPIKFQQFNSKLVDNNPFKNVKLVDQYTALIDDEYIINIDYNFIGDLAVNGLVNKNKKIDGEFVFIKHGHRFHLLRVGSQEYEKIKDMDRRKSLKKVSNKNLIPGAIYATPGGKKYLYLGNVDSCSVGWSNSGTVPPKKKIKNKPLFYRSYKDDFNVVNKINEENIDGLVYKFEIKITHSLVEKVDEIKLLPNVIDNIRNSSIKALKNEIAKYSSNSGVNTRSSIIYSYRKYSPLINGYQSGDKNSKDFDIEKYMMLT